MNKIDNVRRQLEIVDQSELPLIPRWMTEGVRKIDLDNILNNPFPFFGKFWMMPHSLAYHFGHGWAGEFVQQFLEKNSERELYLAELILEGKAYPSDTAGRNATASDETGTGRTRWELDPDYEGAKFTITISRPGLDVLSAVFRYSHEHEQWSVKVEEHCFRHLYEVRHTLYLADAVLALDCVGTSVQEDALYQLASWVQVSQEELVEALLSVRWLGKSRMIVAHECSDEEVEQIKLDFRVGEEADVQLVNLEEVFHCSLKRRDMLLLDGKIYIQPEVAVEIAI